MTTIFSLLFLKINVRLFSQSSTDGLVQFCRNFIYVTLSIKFYILNTLSIWSECSFHFLLSHYFTSGLLKSYILLKLYPETVDENIFLDQLNRHSLLMANEARICQRYRRYPKRTSQAPSSCIFLCDDGSVPRCTDSGDDFNFVYSSVCDWRLDLHSSIFMSLF